MLQVVVSKRIRQTLRVTLAPQEFMPDILADWEIQQRCVRTCNPLTYLHHLWCELWALPPPVDESGLSEKIVLATNVPGVGNKQAEFSHRDKVFLLGRQAREFPVLSVSLRIAVAVQFLLTLAVGYAVMLAHGHEDKINLAVGTMLHNSTSPRDGFLMTNSATMAGLKVLGGAQGENVIRLGMALICVLCVLSLQSIKLYYK